MYDEPQVGLVDPHPKGVGGYDHRQLARHEPFLHLTTFVARQTGMVQAHATARGFPSQFALHSIGHLFAPLSSRRVNDARAGRVAEECEQDFVLLAHVTRLLDLETQIRSSETGNKRTRLDQTQQPSDVPLDGRRGGGRECNCLRKSQTFAELSEPCVVGTEVMAPFADAMGFINGKQLNLGLPDGVQKLAVSQAFRSDIHQVEFASSHRLQPG